MGSSGGAIVDVFGADLTVEVVDVSGFVGAVVEVVVVPESPMPGVPAPEEQPARIRTIATVATALRIGGCGREIDHHGEMIGRPDAMVAAGTGQTGADRIADRFVPGPPDE